MDASNRKYHDVVLLGAVAIALFMLMKKTPLVAEAPADASNLDPMQLVFASNPSQFEPATLNIEVTPELPAGLNNEYIPMFGFVGMAQGVMLT